MVLCFEPFVDQSELVVEPCNLGAKFTAEIFNQVGRCKLTLD